MPSTIRKSALTVAALGALGLGGSAVAGAAGTASPSATPQNARPRQDPLSADVAAKVKAAALAKVPGATVVRTEGGGPYSTPYHAHIKKSDGTLQVVLVNSEFKATAVQADQGGPPRAGAAWQPVGDHHEVGLSGGRYL